MKFPLYPLDFEYRSSSVKFKLSDIVRILLVVLVGFQENTNWIAHTSSSGGGCSSCGYKQDVKQLIVSWEKQICVSKSPYSSAVYAASVADLYYTDAVKFGT